MTKIINHKSKWDSCKAISVRQAMQDVDSNTIVMTREGGCIAIEKKTDGYAAVSLPLSGGRQTVGFHDEDSIKFIDEGLAQAKEKTHVLIAWNKDGCSIRLHIWKNSIDECLIYCVALKGLRIIIVSGNRIVHDSTCKGNYLDGEIEAICNELNE